MEDKTYSEFLQFLKEEILISNAELNVALKAGKPEDPCLLAMTLWSYGFVSMETLNCLFSWLKVV